MYNYVDLLGIHNYIDTMPYQIDFIHIPYTYNYVRMLHRPVYIDQHKLLSCK